MPKLFFKYKNRSQKLGDNRLELRESVVALNIGQWMIQFVNKRGKHIESELTELWKAIKMSGIPVTRGSEEKEFQESQRSQGVKETMADLIQE